MCYVFGYNIKYKFVKTKVFFILNKKTQKLLTITESRGWTGRKFWHRFGYGTWGKNQYRVGTGSGLRVDTVQLKMYALYEIEIIVMTPH